MDNVIASILIPACSMLIAAFSLLGVIKERNERDAKNDAAVESRIEQWGELMTSINAKLDSLLDGYNSNEKRITLLEDRHKALSHRVGDLEKRSWGVDKD